MDDMALFVAGYYAGKKKGGASPSPLSLEGIKALKTLATVTVGNFVIEIKEPKMFYGGKLEAYYNVTAFKSGRWENGWFTSAIINDSLAVVSGYPHAYEKIYWGDYEESGKKYSTEYQKCSDFSVTGINLNSNNYRLPNMTVSFSYKQSKFYDGVFISGYTNTSGSAVDFYADSTPVIHNFSIDEYFDFVRSYCEAAAANEPVINIL